jgi:hypothetical protein
MSLNGATIGILRNNKVNARRLLGQVARALRERFESRDVVGPILTTRGMLASSEQLDELAERCDFVFSGVGDEGRLLGVQFAQRHEIEKPGTLAIACMLGALCIQGCCNGGALPIRGTAMSWSSTHSPALRPEGIVFRAERALPDILSIALGLEPLDERDNQPK